MPQRTKNLSNEIGTKEVIDEDEGDSSELESSEHEDSYASRAHKFCSKKERSELRTNVAAMGHWRTLFAGGCTRKFPQQVIQGAEECLKKSKKSMPRESSCRREVWGHGRRRGGGGGGPRIPRRSGGGR